MDESATFLKEIEPAVLEHLSDEIKNFSSPSFPIEKLAQKLKTTLNTQSFEIEIGLQEWKSHESLFNGLSTNPISLPLELTPLEGSLFWVMGLEDIEKLISWSKFLKSGEMKVRSPELLRGIYRFVALEVIDVIAHLNPFTDLSLKLTEQKPFDEACFAIDISIKNGDESVWGRLVLSKAIKRSFETHFAIKQVTLKDLEKTSGQISLQLAFNIGRVELNQDQLQNLKVGDFVLPDALYYNPKTQKGNVRVMLGEKALFLAKPKEDHIKLIDTIFAYQENTYG